MERANPVQMRKSLVIVDELKKAGILFIPIPVMDEEDYIKLIGIMHYRMNRIEALVTQQTSVEDPELPVPDCKA